MLVFIRGFSIDQLYVFGNETASTSTMEATSEVRSVEIGPYLRDKVLWSDSTSKLALTLRRWCVCLDPGHESAFDE